MAPLARRTLIWSCTSSSFTIGGRRILKAFFNNIFLHRSTQNRIYTEQPVVSSPQASYNLKSKSQNQGSGFNWASEPGLGRNRDKELILERLKWTTSKGNMNFKALDVFFGQLDATSRAWSSSWSTTANFLILVTQWKPRFGSRSGSGLTEKPGYTSGIKSTRIRRTPSSSWGKTIGR